MYMIRGEVGQALALRGCVGQRDFSGYLSGSDMGGLFDLKAEKSRSQELESEKAPWHLLNEAGGALYKPLRFHFSTP